MKTSPSRKGSRVLPGLETRLLDELKRSDAGRQSPEAPAGDPVALYREAIERLEEQVARRDGHPPMRKLEVELMCRCLLSCRTLAEAIHCAADFCAMLHPRAGALSLEVQGNTATFRMDSLRQRRSSAACLVDLTGLLCYLQLFGWLIGQPLPARDVFLGHPRREDAVPFLGLFNAPVTVGAKTYGFTFDSALLSRRIVRQPGELDAFVADFPFRLIGQPPAVVSLAQQVRGFLDAALARDLALPTLAEVAECFAISEPTLRRRLSGEGTGYHVLYEECRRQAAERCLRNTDWPIGRIAEHLGFSSEDAFRRAFLRWTGHAPSRFRQGAQVRG